MHIRRPAYRHVRVGYDEYTMQLWKGYGAMIRILVADKLAEEGLEVLKESADVEFEFKTGMSEDELAEAVREFDGLIVRSAVKVTAKVLENPGRLRAIARAGVGVDTIDVAAATRKGIIVMNTPDGNTISTAEQTITLMMALSRNTAKAVESLKAGKWDRKSFMGVQLAGKTLGVIGLGRIGRAVAARAVGMEMKVLGYDPYFSPSDDMADKGHIQLIESIDDMIPQCDYLTVHTPMTDQTRSLINAERLSKAKPTLRLVNCARGGIIDEKDLLEALKAGTVAGAGIDVYTEEPPESDHIKELIAHENVVCTPHLGASTIEAQVQVAVDAAKQLIDALRGGQARSAVNVPGLSRGISGSIKPYYDLCSRMGTVLSRITPGQVRKISVSFSGQVAERETAALTTGLLIGVLQPQLEEAVNVVNAPLLAKERNIKIDQTTSDDAGNFTSLIAATVETEHGSHSVTGTVFSKELGRIVAIDGYGMEMVPADDLVISFNDDVPGVIGAVGNLFGMHNINIASMTFGRKQATQKAVLVLTLDAAPPVEVLDEMASLPFMDTVHHISLPPESEME